MFLLLTIVNGRFFWDSAIDSLEKSRNVFRTFEYRISP